MFVNDSGAVMDMHAFIYDNGTTDIGIKMVDTKNLNKWTEYSVAKYTLHEALDDGTQYETEIEAGRIRLYKNGIERWKQDVR